MDTNETNERGPEEEAQLIPSDEKRRLRLRRGWKSLVIALVLLIVLVAFTLTNIGGLVWVIVNIAFVVYLIAGIVYLIAGLMTKGG